MYRTIDCVNAKSPFNIDVYSLFSLIRVFDLPSHFAPMMAKAWSSTQDQDAIPRLRRLCGGVEMTLGIYYELHFLADEDNVGKLCVCSSGQATKRRFFVIACTNALHLQMKYPRWLQRDGERFSKLPEDRITHLFVCQMALASWAHVIDMEKARRIGPASQRLNWGFTEITNGTREVQELPRMLMARTEAIRRITACLQQNRKIVEWIYLRIAGEHDHTVAEKLGYTEILEEYDSFIQQAEYVRQRFHMDHQNVSKADIIGSNFLCELRSTDRFL